VFSLLVTPSPIHSDVHNHPRAVRATNRHLRSSDDKEKKNKREETEDREREIKHSSFVFSFLNWTVAVSHFAESCL